jgi:type I restriction enzyme S subunit
MTNEYVHAVLDSPAFRSHALGFCNGTTVVHMASAAVLSFEAPLPDREQLLEFSEPVRVLRDEADASLTEAERLEQTRDELLPLLLSGRVCVGEVAA